MLQPVCKPLLSLLIISTCTSCTASALPTPPPLPEQEVLVIGAALGLSGDIAGYGTSQRQGIQLAEKAVESSSYMESSLKLQAIFEDTGATADGAALAVEKLINDHRAAGLIGPTLSSQALVADPIAQRSGVPIIAISNTAPGIVETGHYIFRCSMPESAVIAATVKMAGIQGTKKAGILWGNDDSFTVGGYKAFKQACQKYGIELLVEEQFTRGETDFQDRLTRILSSAPNAICVSALIKEAVPIVKQLRSLGYTGLIIGGNGFNTTELIRQAGEAANGVMVGTAWNYTSTNIRNIEFINSFQKSYGNKPDQFAAQAYTSVWLYADALKTAKSIKPGAIRDALAKLSNLNTPLGLFSFNKEREPVHTTGVQLVKDGKFTILNR
jgi:branched-chain amino acid transport system substrate-binding protein